MSRKQRIYDALIETLKPHTLIIDDESSRHHVPEGAESHFKVVAVGECFEDLNRIARHRLINNLLAPEFQTGLHALTLHLYTQQEWLKKEGAPASPACRNGKHHG